MKKQHIIIVGIVAVLVFGGTLLLLPSKKQAPAESDTVVTSSAKKMPLGRITIEEARARIEKAIHESGDIVELEKIQSDLGQMNMQALFSPAFDSCSTEYIVVPNDVLSKIAKKFGTTVNLIKRANNIPTDIIRIGQKLKVNTCAFSVVVDKSQNRLFLKRQGDVFKTYIVSTGTDNSTPVGTFILINKLRDPTWYKTGAVIPPDSPENILGTRWMGFDLKGYGIHGTTKPEDLGKQVTLGCIRMKNEEVEEVYDILPVGTEVVIID